ncbi:hypothetical protein EVAR_39_1 [Eumeta japonica]|uniref:Uncharacterized protein n=1 Tax=Eumeta variegata TaxID=151549 RepID=A0A4C1S7Q4_EUMVA|nr:hypothetical protein EVAR_39_1 [Eumeta japonica]
MEVSKIISKQDDWLSVDHEAVLAMWNNGPSGTPPQVTRPSSQATTARFRASGVHIAAGKNQHFADSRSGEPSVCVIHKHGVTGVHADKRAGQAAFTHLARVDYSPRPLPSRPRGAHRFTGCCRRKCEGLRHATSADDLQLIIKLRRFCIIFAGRGAFGSRRRALHSPIHAYTVRSFSNLYLSICMYHTSCEIELYFNNIRVFTYNIIQAD